VGTGATEFQSLNGSNHLAGVRAGRLVDGFEDGVTDAFREARTRELRRDLGVDGVEDFDYGYFGEVA